jgi:hypothetical protein
MAARPRSLGCVFAKRLAGKPTGSAYYFFMVGVIIRYKTTAAARWALLFVVCTFFNDTFTVAVWTSFHTCLMWVAPHSRLPTSGRRVEARTSLGMRR